MIDLKKLYLLFGLGAIFGVAIGLLRGVIQYKHDGLGNFVRGVCASMLVAVLVSLMLDSMIWPDSMKAAVVGICSYVADDILVSLLVLSNTMRTDPTGFIQRWLPNIFKSKGNQNG